MPITCGQVAPGFEEVREEFKRNFTERGEIGAAVAAYWHGEKVVDLWGGRRTPDDDALWQEDTLVCVMSSTKGLSAMTLALANARGWLDYEAPVAYYWPDFAQNGKQAITVRQLLGHEAGLVLLDEKLTIARMRDLEDVACRNRDHSGDHGTHHRAARYQTAKRRSAGSTNLFHIRFPAIRPRWFLRLDSTRIRCAGRWRVIRICRS